MKDDYIQDLAFIALTAEEKEMENDRFRDFLKQQDAEQIDEQVTSLNAEVSAGVDCMQCGNCCRSLMINVSVSEAGNLSRHLGMQVDTFTEKFIEQSAGGQMIINTIPCHFLAGNTCSIYEQRFEECREFPRLHRPGFTRRLLSSFMHYGRCPIIFNVVEQLKTCSGFFTEAPRSVGTIDA